MTIAAPMAMKIPPIINRVRNQRNPDTMNAGKNQSSARPRSKVASAISGGGAITPGLSRDSFIGQKLELARSPLISTLNHAVIA